MQVCDKMKLCNSWLHYWMYDQQYKRNLRLYITGCLTAFVTISKYSTDNKVAKEVVKDKKTRKTSINTKNMVVTRMLLFKATTYAWKNWHDIQRRVENFNRIAAITDGPKLIENIPLYLKDQVRTYYRRLDEGTKYDADELKESLTNILQKPEKKYTLEVNLFSLWETDSLDSLDR